MRDASLIPAHNEERSIAEVLTRTRTPRDRLQLIVVDDGSSDSTATIAARTGATVLRQPHSWRGAAICAAIPHIDAEIVVIQDADMEYAPTEVPALIERHNAPTTARY
jgi:glycosyltransferase involved in cell wall biosynthesis